MNKVSIGGFLSAFFVVINVGLFILGSSLIIRGWNCKEVPAYIPGPGACAGKYIGMMILGLVFFGMILGGLMLLFKKTRGKE